MNDVVFDFENVTGLYADLAGGNDTIRFQGDVVINGFVEIMGGGGDDIVEIPHDASLLVSGDFSFDGNRGDDSAISYGAVDNTLFVFGNTTIDTGTDRGHVALGMCSFLGDLTVKSGDADGDLILLAPNAATSSSGPLSLFVSGNLSVNTGDGLDRLIMHNAKVNGFFDLQMDEASPFYSISRTEVLHDVNISLGGGDHWLTLRENHFRQNLTLLTGRGNDQIHFEDCNIGRAATIRTRRGDDTVTFSHSHIGSILSANGGRGSEDRLSFFVTSVGRGVTHVGFEFTGNVP
ncbi:MAG: hypothetical protein AB8G99_13890 [Planctomycetaceae bacterium]